MTPPKKTLADLEKIIGAIDLGGDDSMKGVSYDKTTNNTLGFGKTHTSFHVAIPFTTFPKGDPADWKVPSESTLEEAFKDVLDSGFSALDTTALRKLAAANHQVDFFIDIAHLCEPHPEFFTNKSTLGDYPGTTVAGMIAKVVNGISDYKNVRPVVRFLMGMKGDVKLGDVAGTVDAMERNIHAMFWPGDHALIDNPNAEIYLGYYGPNFSTTGHDSEITEDVEDAAAAAVKWQQKLLEQFKKRWKSEHYEKFAAKLPKYNAKGLIEKILKGMDCISWNHGKIVAVNGTHMMTGGANFWSEYAINHAGVYDMQAKINGDAAISAHKYCDYFWEYLQGDHGTDKRSHLRMSNLKTLHWVVKDEKTKVQVPMFSDKKRTRNPSSEVPTIKMTGNTPVLTVSKLGDWHGKMKHIRFPVQVIDAARDTLINIAWHFAHSFRYGLVSGILDQLLPMIEDISDQKSLGDLKSMNILPAAWISRHVRIQAILSARTSVKLSVEHFVMPDLAGKDEWKKLMKEEDERVMQANEAKELGDEEKWNGYLWPYDLFLAIADCILRKVHVYAIVSTSKYTTEELDGYRDRVTITDCKMKLQQVVNLYVRHKELVLTDGNPWDHIETYFHPVRLLKNIGRVNHCKVVCVDDELLYIGSENAYPSFNEEHGVWVDDETAIKAWGKDFWDPLWVLSEEKGKKIE